ncbi:unnamed protein product [Gadus morhua 'NCC']
MIDLYHSGALHVNKSRCSVFGKRQLGILTINYGNACSFKKLACHEQTITRDGRQTITLSLLPQTGSCLTSQSCDGLPPSPVMATTTGYHNSLTQQATTTSSHNRLPQQPHTTSQYSSLLQEEQYSSLLLEEAGVLLLLEEEQYYSLLLEEL